MKQGLKFKVTIQEKGDEHELLIEKDSFVIGRAQTADVVIDNDLISRRQLTVTLNKDNVWIEEMGSSNGSWINGRKLETHEKLIVKSHDKIAVGSKQGPFLYVELESEAKEVVQEDVTRDDIRIETVKEVGGGEYRPVPLPQKPKVRSLEESSEKIINLKNDAERGLFEQIKRMVGKEAESVRLQALDEARHIKARAEEDAKNHLKSIRSQATEHQKESERSIAEKKAAFEALEKEVQGRITLAKRDHQELLDNIKNLEDREVQQEKLLKHLSDSVAREEERIELERKELNKEIQEYEETKKAFDTRYEEFIFEERKTKARLETEMIEAKLKASQIMAEADKALAARNALEPEIKALKIEKENCERELRETTYNRESQQREIDRITKECDLATRSLEQTKEFQQSINRELEQKREEIRLKFEELKSRTQEFEDWSMKTKSDAETLLRDANLEVTALQNRKLGLVKEIEIERENELRVVREDAEKLKSKERIEIEKLKEKRKFVLGEIEKIVADTKLSNDKLLKEAMAQGEAAKLESMQEAANVKKQADAYFVDAKNNARTMIEKADNSVKKIREDGLRETQKIEEQKAAVLAEIEQLNQVRARHSAETEVKIKKMLDDADVAVKGVLQRGDVDFKEQKTKQENKLAELKHLEMMNIKDLRVKAEEEIRKNQNDKAKEVATNVYALITAEMIKAKNKVLDDILIEAFTNEVKEMVSDTLLGKMGPDSDRLQEILKTSENARNKEKIFWKRVMVGGGAFVFVVLLLIAFPSIISGPVGLIAGIFSDDKGPNSSDAFLEQIKEARIKAVYNPPTTPEFKSSYVDNFLFTTDFVSKIKDQSFQDKWIVELNEYFIRDLDVKDTTLIKFVSLETNLIKDLEKLKSEADTNNPEPKIEEMKKREAEFRKRLAGVFDDPEKVGRYYSYQMRFWNNFYNVRRPSGVK